MFCLNTNLNYHNHAGVCVYGGSEAQQGTLLPERVVRGAAAAGTSSRGCTHLAPLGQSRSGFGVSRLTVNTHGKAV